MAGAWLRERCYSPAVFAALGTNNLGLSIRGASLALDAIIIPNYSAVEPKGYCPSRCTAGNHYEPATTRSEIERALLDAAAFGSCSWPPQKLTEPAISLAVLWDRTARPQYCLRKKLLVERTNGAVPQFSISGLHKARILLALCLIVRVSCKERDDLRRFCRMSWK